MSGREHTSTWLTDADFLFVLLFSTQPLWIWVKETFVPLIA
jgi:hypothetical protein